MTNQGGVFITQEQIYDEVLGLKDGFGEVKALLEQHIALETQRNESVEVRLENHGTRLSDQSTQIVDLNSRVTKLESTSAEASKKEGRRATWPQVIGAVGVLIASTAATIGMFITLSNISQALTHLP